MTDAETAAESDRGTDPVPLSAYYDLTRITDVALSPNGDRLAVVADEFDADADETLSSLFVVPTDGRRDPHRLTRVPGASHPRWGPAGDRLAFVAAREADVSRRVGRPDDEAGDADADDDATARDGDEDEPESQVWLFDLVRGGDARQVTDREEGVDAFDWSPDGDRLVVAARDPTDDQRASLEDRRDGGPIVTERLQHKVDGVGWTDDVTRYLFVVDVETGAETRLDGAHGGGAMEDQVGMSPAWGADDRIAFTSCRTADPDDTLVRDAYAISPDGSDLTTLTDSDLSVLEVAWSPDGERLAFIAQDPENWCLPRQVYLHDGEGYESLTADLDRTLGWEATVEWADDETLYTLLADEGLTRPVRVTADGDADRAFDAQGEGRAAELLSVAGDTAAVVLSDPREGREAYALPRSHLDGEAGTDGEEVSADAAAGLTRLTAFTRSVVETDEMPRCRRVTYDSGGHEIEGLVYHPPGFDPADPYAARRPLVVAIHGGPISYDEPVFDFAHAALVSRGYVVFRPNYRGSTSYGRAFAEELRGRWGSVEVDDIAAGVESLVDRGWADADRVFGYGFSYGGIAQGYLVTQTDLLTAAAPEHGIYDLRSSYGTDDSHVWLENDFGLPWEDAAAYDAASAITDAGDIDAPLLVLAGGEDWRCPPSQSEQLYVAAKKVGVDARLVVYPGESHAITDPDRMVHRLSEILDWYEAHDPGRDADAPSSDDAADETAG